MLGTNLSEDSVIVDELDEETEAFLARCHLRMKVMATPNYRRICSVTLRVMTNLHPK